MNPLDRSIAMGPLGMSLGLLLFILALVVALIVGAWVGRRRQVNVGDLLFNALLVGVIGARIVFVARYWESYDTFWSWFDIRDRGFEPLAGLIIAFAYLAWRFWRHRAVRRPLVAAVLSGALAWSITAGALMLMAPRGANLPTVPLADLPICQRSCHPNGLRGDQRALPRRA
ncbi:prolipoprotein diacylglyceryl transferase family protein [Chromohalobacter israelensis]|uniref:prolipoprotein diacylglyceryl transferase family protein n=1 Tax=Chromohalobacter israelensis TaxID=141390 RepID=UPI003D7AEE98